MITEIKNWANKKILLVDDVEFIHIHIAALLRKTGVELFSVQNAENAFDILENNPDISLILMDIQMPNMSGELTMQKIKRLKPNIPIIAQTAHALNGDREKYLSEGFDGYISKPINRDKLFEVISKFLR